MDVAQVFGALQPMSAATRDRPVLVLLREPLGHALLNWPDVKMTVTIAIWRGLPINGWVAMNCTTDIMPAAEGEAVHYYSDGIVVDPIGWWPLPEG